MLRREARLCEASRNVAVVEVICAINILLLRLHVFGLVRPLLRLAMIPLSMCAMSID